MTTSEFSAPQIYRSSLKRFSVKKVGLKNVANFTGKNLCWSLFLKKLQAFRQTYQKEIPTQVFFCEICEIFKNTYFEDNL